MKIGDQVKLFRRSENTNNWIEMRDERGNAYKGIIKDFSYSKTSHTPVFAFVLIKEKEDLYSEELLSLNSPCFKLIRC